MDARLDPIESLARQVFGNPSLRRRIAEQVATPTREVRLPGFESAANTDFYNEHPDGEHPIGTYGRGSQRDFADSMDMILFNSLFPGRFIDLELHDITQVALSPALFNEWIDYSRETPAQIVEQEQAQLEGRIRTNDYRDFREMLLRKRKKRLLTDITKKMNGKWYPYDRNRRPRSRFNERRFNQ